jgi:cytochrome c oxidase cbb3-type subunit 3/ubiquinol-cytochrome c reductase cytochrome c subunit
MCEARSFYNGRRGSVTLSPCHLVTLSGFLLAGCSWPGRPDPADRPVSENQVVKFETLFGQHCAGCHGADGKVGPAPPLNDPLFRAGVDEKELVSVISSGRPGTPMPAFAADKGGSLTPAQIQILVYEVKGIPYKARRKAEGEAGKIEVVRDAQGVAPKWGLPGSLPNGAPPLQATEDKPRRSPTEYEQIRSTVFARACAACHGDRGQGFEQRGERRRSINDPAFLALVSDQALRRYVITGRPDLGMPNYAAARPGDPHFRPLDAREVTDLVALLAKWRQAGSTGGK